MDSKISYKLLFVTHYWNYDTLIIWRELPVKSEYRVIIILYCVLYYYHTFKNIHLTKQRGFEAKMTVLKCFPLKLLWVVCILNNCYEGPKFSIMFPCFGVVVTIIVFQFPYWFRSGFAIDSRIDLFIINGVDYFRSSTADYCTCTCFRILL